MFLIGFVTQLPFINKTLYNNLPFEKAIYPVFIQKFRALQYYSVIRDGKELAACEQIKLDFV